MKWTDVPATCIVFLLQQYKRWISPWLPQACRFYPTCSVYAMEVITTHGLLRGGWLATCRVCRCNPFHEGGVDMPPAASPPPEHGSGYA